MFLWKKNFDVFASGDSNRNVQKSDLKKISVFLCVSVCVKISENSSSCFSGIFQSFVLKFDVYLKQRGDLFDIIFKRLIYGSGFYDNLNFLNQHLCVRNIVLLKYEGTVDDLQANPPSYSLRFVQH